MKSLILLALVLVQGGVLAQDAPADSRSNAPVSAQNEEPQSHVDGRGLAQRSPSMKDILDFVQTLVAIAALCGSAYAIQVQRRDMAVSARLNAAATLFEYYNLKISSLRNSIVRDTGSREDALLEPVERRKARLKELLREHEEMFDNLKEKYRH